MDDAAHPSHASIERAAVTRAERAAPDADDALISAALAGDGGALARVWEQERRWVAAVLLAHKPREADLEDLLQDVALTLVSKIGDVRDAAGFRPWLRAVAVSVARTRGRRQKVRRQGFLKLVAWARSELEGGGPEVRAETATTHRAGGGADRAAASAIEHGRRLLDLSAELPEGYREPLLLKSVQGMSYRQIGRVMGLPETTIETRIARARRMLRERAERDEHGRQETADDSHQETEHLVVARAAQAPGSGVTS